MSSPHGVLMQWLHRCHERIKDFLDEGEIERLLRRTVSPIGRFPTRNDVLTMRT